MTHISKDYLIRQLRKQNRDQAKELVDLRTAKLSIAGIFLQEERDFPTTQLEITAINNTPKGIVLEVRKPEKVGGHKL
jgi:hypothetical protein